MIRKFFIFFCSTLLFTSCQKEIISVWILQGKWTIEELYVKQDFAGKKSEYFISNAGTIQFKKENEGATTSAQDTTIKVAEFNWVMEDKNVIITYNTDSSKEIWNIIERKNNEQIWECTQTIKHESGGISTQEIRYRKIKMVR